MTPKPPHPYAADTMNFILECLRYGPANWTEIQDYLAAKNKFVGQNAIAAALRRLNIRGFRIKKHHPKYELLEQKVQPLDAQYLLDLKHTP